MKHDLIVFGEDWGGLPSSTQYLITHLAKERKIVWVNSIGLRRPTFSMRDIKRAIKKLIGKKILVNKFSTNNTSALEKNVLPSKNFHIVYPRTLSAPRSCLGRWLATRLIVSQVMPIIQKTNLYSPILWISLPTAVDIAGKLGESALVYYCGDDFSALTGVDHDTVSMREAELSEKADLILCASDKLVKKFTTSYTYLLPHGVDYSLFSKPAPRADDLPDDGRPIAGFYGSISEWLDLEILQKTIQQMPDWHFVFIGKAVVDISPLTSLKNVHVLGERPHNKLPSYSQHWTASLLPFTDNAQIKACNPLKLREYLAAGRPIICTSFPAMKPFRGLVQVANSTAAMIEALRSTEYIGSLPYFPGVLRKTVSESSWASRALQTTQWLDAL